MPDYGLWVTVEGAAEGATWYLCHCEVNELTAWTYANFHLRLTHRQDKYLMTGAESPAVLEVVVDCLRVLWLARYRLRFAMKNRVPDSCGASSILSPFCRYNERQDC